MKYLIRVLIAINLLVGIGWITSFAWNSYVRHERQAKEGEVAAERMEKAGFMKKSDWQRLGQVERFVKDTGGLKDQDVEWACAAINASFKKDQAHGSMDRSWITLTLAHGLKRVTPEQRNKIYNAILPMATTHDENDAYTEDKPMFCYVSKALGEPKAIPVMLPFLNDPRPRVRKPAKRAIEFLQKQSANPVPSR